MKDQYGHLMPREFESDPHGDTGPPSNPPAEPDPRNATVGPQQSDEPETPPPAKGVGTQQPSPTPPPPTRLVDQIPGESYEERGYRYTRIRPAYRSFLRQWALAIPGALLLISPSFVASLVMGAVGALVSLVAGQEVGSAIALPQSEGAGPALWEVVARIGGLILVLWSLGAIAYKRLANRFKVSEETVIQEYGLIKRERSQMNLVHIRAVDVRQGVIERLLGIGRLYFAGAGTAGTDVRWFGIRDPETVQSVIQRVIQSAGGHGPHGD